MGRKILDLDFKCSKCWTPEHVEALPEDLQVIAALDGANEAVKDYIAGMTDRFALNTYTELFVPRAWK